MQELRVLGVWVRKHMKWIVNWGCPLGRLLVLQCCQTNIGWTSAVAGGSYDGRGFCIMLKNLFI